MSFALFLIGVYLGCSPGGTFVLHSSEKEPDASSGLSARRTNRCQGESLQSIRKTLLRGLNIQMEPIVAVGSLTKLREQWKTSFSAISHTAQEQAVPAVYSEGPSFNSTVPKCCQLSSQIFLKDLGWENWVIYPESFTYVQCAPCKPQLELSTQRCPSHYPNAPSNPTEMPCCQPTSQEVVPFLYVDELNTMAISSVQLTRTCDCERGIDPLSKDG